MSRHGLNSRKRRYWIRLQWAPILRATRHLAITAKQTPPDNNGNLLPDDPSVHNATRKLKSAALSWYNQWYNYRTDAGKPIPTTEDLKAPPTNEFHRIQQACKAYGLSLRKDVGQTGKQEAIAELLNAVVEAPLGQGPFTLNYSSEQSCNRILMEFPDLALPKPTAPPATSPETTHTHTSRSPHP